MTMTEQEPIPGETLYREHETYIKKLARDTAYSYQKVDEEDVIQEVWVWLWQYEAVLLEQNRSPEYVRVCIKNIVWHFAQKMRNQVFITLDTFYFNVDEVKAFLPTYFSGYESWANSSVPFGAETMTPGDNIEMFCDFTLAFERLSEKQQEILRRKYDEDEVFDLPKDRQALSRATRKFMTLLNQHKDMDNKDYSGPGIKNGKTSGVTYED